MQVIIEWTTGVTDTVHLPPAAIVEPSEVATLTSVLTQKPRGFIGHLNADLNAAILRERIENGRDVGDLGTIHDQAASLANYFNALMEG